MKISSHSREKQPRDLRPRRGSFQLLPLEGARGLLPARERYRQAEQEPLLETWFTLLTSVLLHLSFR